MRHLTSVSLTALLVIAPVSGAWAQENTGPLATQQDRIYYSIGYQLGTRLQRLQQRDANMTLEPLLKGLLDATRGATPLMPEAEMAAARSGLAATGTRPTDGKPRKSPYPVRARGYVDDYAALNAEREGVVVLPSGLQYKVLASGTGRQASADSTVSVRYRATLANGVEFDNTYDQKEPELLRIDQLVVRGLQEALPLMKEGDKWRITIPAPLGYTGGRLLRKRDLIYELELVSVQTPETPASPPTPASGAGGG